jgi:hypothetical protein
MERMSADKLLSISNINKRTSIDIAKHLIYTEGIKAANKGETFAYINFDEHNIHHDMRGYMEGFAKQVFPGVTAFRTATENSVIRGTGDRLFMDWSYPK